MATAALVIAVIALLASAGCAWALLKLQRRGGVIPVTHDAPSKPVRFVARDGTVRTLEPFKAMPARVRPRSARQSPLRVARFPIEAFAELRLVVWPSWASVRSHAGAAFLGVVVMTALVTLISAFVLLI